MMAFVQMRRLHVMRSCVRDDRLHHFQNVINKCSYDENTELAYLLSLVGQKDEAMKYLDIAAVIVSQNFVTSTMVAKRVVNRGDIGTLESLPDDILFKICDEFLLRSPCN
jgi:hypothetical protein